MAIQQETMFEAPMAHEASHYSNPEASHYSNPEFEDEASHYGNPYTQPEQEDEAEADRMLGKILGGIFGEGESEAEVTRVLNSILGEDEVGHEFEDETSHYSTPEMEYEADRFIGKAFRKIKRFAKGFKRFLPGIIGKIAGAIPGVGIIAGPLAGKLASTLIREAEMEVAEMENHFVNMLAQTGEVEHPEVHEAFLTELMAGQAAMAATEAEAEAIIAATVPMTMSNMRALRSVLPITPAVVQANVQLVRALRRQGPQGRQLLRLHPTILRHAIAILRHAARIQRLTTPMAVQAVSIAANRVMSNPKRVERAIQRNVALQVRAAQMSRPRGVLPLRSTPRRRRVSAW
jgi:hypothetical protein